MKSFVRKIDFHVVLLNITVIKNYNRIQTRKTRMIVFSKNKLTNATIRTPVLCFFITHNQKKLMQTVIKVNVFNYLIFLFALFLDIKSLFKYGSLQ